MNAQVIIAVVQLLAGLVGSFTTNAQIAAAITIMEAWLPTIIAEIPELVADVQGIIATLQGADDLTPEQIASITAMSAETDAAADAALSQAEKEI